MAVGPRVLVYRGRGAGPVAVKEMVASLKVCLPQATSIRLATAEDLRSGAALNDAALLAFPGGRDVPYHEDLQGTPNANIRRWVEAGGAFLGICAGAYYGAAEVQFEKGQPLEVTGKRELAFFPGKASGPVYGLGRFEYESEAAAAAADMEILGKRLHVYYNGGCHLENVDDHAANVTVFGRHLDHADTPVSVVGCQVEKGRALLSGVHLDYRPEPLVQRGLHPDKVALLHAHNVRRKQVLTQLLQWVLRV